MFHTNNIIFFANFTRFMPLIISNKNYILKIEQMHAMDLDKSMFLLSLLYKKGELSAY